MPPSPDLASAPLSGVRVLSLALNLPGPAALMRCRAMGASCLKFEPPAGDPMAHYNRAAYAALQEGVARDGKYGTLSEPVTGVPPVDARVDHGHGDAGSGGQRGEPLRGVPLLGPRHGGDRD